jgi:hypothetical protein
MQEPKSPAQAYRAIIDQLVTETRVSGLGPMVVEGFRSTSAMGERYNAFLESLTASQRGSLAELLQEERSGAIHDVLSALSWWISTREVALTFGDRPMPVGLSGMGLHGDYVGRCADWEWPSTGSTSG